MLEFEWDEAKNIANQDKHGVSFAEAKELFFASHLVVPARNQGESRYIAIGFSINLLLAIVFTYRNDKIRLISARRARENEKKAYHEFCKNEK